MIGIGVVLPGRWDTGRFGVRFVEPCDDGFGFGLGLGGDGERGE